MPGCRPLDAEIDRRYARVEPQVITFIDPNLAERTTAVLQMVAGKGPVVQVPVVTGAKDSSFYQGEIPGLDFFLGVTPEGTDPDTAPMCRLLYSHADERGLVVGASSPATRAWGGRGNTKPVINRYKLASILYLCSFDFNAGREGAGLGRDVKRRGPSAGAVWKSGIGVEIG
jgi:hypothetical protein